MTSTTQPRSKTNLLMLAYIAFVTLGLPSGLLGVAWPTLRQDFSLPLDAMGLSFFSFTIGYLLSSFFISRLINRFGISTLLITASLISAVTSLGFAIAPAWSVIIALGIIGGFGAGTLDAGFNTYLASEYNESQMQWLHASFGIGATLSPLIMTASLALFGSWRPGYAFVGCIMVAMAVCFFLTRSAWKRPSAAPTENAPSENAERNLMDYRTPLRQTLLRVVTWVSILMFLLYTGAELTLGNWTYTLLTVSRGITPQIAGLWAGGFWATFTIGRILGGIYAHRVKLNTLMLSAMGLALVGALIFWWNPLPLLSVVGVFLTGFAMAPIFAGLVSSTGARVGQKHAANTIGIQISAAGLGGALLPSLAGFLAQRISLEAIPGMLSVSLLGLLGLYWVTTRGNKVRRNLNQNIEK